ncbi:MAG: hypothetical protein ABR601_06555 [Parasphingopyxis sp.]|nr:hypothetical protein [Sphingomonadales bacterium]
MTAGYSRTPLARKLGYRDGMTVWQRGMPESVRRTIAAEAEVEWANGDIGNPPAVHVFTAERDELERLLAALRLALVSDGFIWVSWPKKASKIASEVTEDTIREVALPLGSVDIKVCAVDEVWSGLKLVIRKELRE